MPATVRSSDTRRSILDAAQRIMARKGYSAVGINEVLAAAGVPKGSFYHYFTSKDVFGEAMLKSYFEDYFADMDRTLAPSGASGAERLSAYWRQWWETQSADDCQGRCLAVKLGAEVSDLSEPMRLALKDGTDAIVERIARAIGEGIRDGSIPVEEGECVETARTLYGLWLGASVMAKIHRSPASFDIAMATTRRLLGLSQSERSE